MHTCCLRADPALLCLSAVPCPPLVLPLLCSSSSTLAHSRNTQLLHARLHMHANAAVTHFAAPLHCGFVGSRRRRQPPSLHFRGAKCEHTMHSLFFQSLTHTVLHLLCGCLQSEETAPVQVWALL
jgi:hypothetical protein